MSISPCYIFCNSVILAFEQTGKVPALCEAGSNFAVQITSCQSCLVANGASRNSSAIQFFDQFYESGISFCQGRSEVTTSSAATIGSSSHLQTFSTAVSITTTSSCPPYPSFAFPSIVHANASSSITSVTTAQSSSVASTSTYSYGFWLDYTYVRCPTRTINPVFTYPASCLPANYLWGCPPGYLCTPPQVDCDLEVGPPSNSYVCAPSECKPPPAIHTPTITAKQNVSSYSPYPLPTGYFNINPVLFGVDWGFFTANVSITSFASIPTITTIFTTPSPTFTLTPTPTSIPPPATANSNKWIAGPVVGSIAVGVIVLSAIFFLVRRHKRMKRGEAGGSVFYDKAQLDGTEVKPKEIGGNEIGELGDSAIRVEPSELDAGYRAEELGHEPRT